MSKRKTYTMAELRAQLDQIIAETDFMNYDLKDHPKYRAWEDRMNDLREKTYVKVAGFDASLNDVTKIVTEVERSCLSAKCKKTLLAALKKAM